MANKRIPMRQCVGCRQMKPKNELIRVVDSEDGVRLDTAGKKNGRGAYLCPNAECLKLAAKSKGLERSLKAGVHAEIYQELEKEMNAIEK